MPRANPKRRHPQVVQLGQALQRLRDEKGLKQIEVATAAGLAESRISEIENGYNDSGWTMVLRVLEGLDSDLEHLVAAYREVSTVDPADATDP